MTPHPTIRLDYCTHCGGALELVDGTDPDTAARTGQWRETYKCDTCEQRGTYIVDDRAGRERGSGVVSA